MALMGISGFGAKKNVRKLDKNRFDKNKRLDVGVRRCLWGWLWLRFRAQFQQKPSPSLWLQIQIPNVLTSPFEISSVHRLNWRSTNRGHHLLQHLPQNLSMIPRRQNSARETIRTIFHLMNYHNSRFHTRSYLKITTRSCQQWQWILQELGCCRVLMIMIVSCGILAEWTRGVSLSKAGSQQGAITQVLE